MNGKTVISIMVAIGLAIPMGIYYTQVYAFYFEVEPTGPLDVQMVRLDDATPEPVPFTAFKAIDGTSSPIRYRSCFSTTLTAQAAKALYVPVPDAEPRIAPGWFDCFDAVAIGAELEAGTMATFLSVKNIAYGVDRVVALDGDGNGYAWHILNECGTKAYDGTVVGEECPPRPGDGAAD